MTLQRMMYMPHTGSGATATPSATLTRGCAVHAECTMHETLSRCHVTCVKPCSMPACHHALDWLLPDGFAAEMSSSPGTERWHSGADDRGEAEDL